MENNISRGSASSQSNKKLMMIPQPAAQRSSSNVSGVGLQATQLPSVILNKSTTIQQQKKTIITTTGSAKAIQYNHADVSPVSITEHLNNQSLFSDPTLHQNKHYITNLQTYNQNSKREQQQTSPDRLDEYFQSMVANNNQQKITPSTTNINRSNQQLKTASQQHQNQVNVNRSNSQAARGTKGGRKQSTSLQARLAAENLSTSQAQAKLGAGAGNTSLINRNASTIVQQPRIGGANQKALINTAQVKNSRKMQQLYPGSLGSANNAGGANSNFLLQPLNHDNRFNNHHNKDGQMMNIHSNNGSQQLYFMGKSDEQNDSQLSLSHLRTPFKQVNKQRPNRNRTTENQYSRGINQQQNNEFINNVAQISAAAQQNSTPTVNINQYQSPGNNLLTKLASSDEIITGIRSTSKNKRGVSNHQQQQLYQQQYQQRKHLRLQPINLVNKITSNNYDEISDVQDDISAVSYHKPIQSGSYELDMEQKVSKTQTSESKTNNVTENSPKNNNAFTTLKKNPNGASQRRPKNNKERSNAVIQAGFKSSKIPLIKKERSTNKAPNKPEGALVQQQDELLVTFFDKSLVTNNQMSEDEIVVDGEQVRVQGSSSQQVSDFGFNRSINDHNSANADLAINQSTQQPNSLMMKNNEQITSIQLDEKLDRLGKIYHNTPIYDKKDDFRFQGNSGYSNVGRQNLILQQIQHKSHANLTSDNVVDSSNQRNIQKRSSAANKNLKLNSSLMLNPTSSSNQQRNQNQVDIKNLHPQGLYLGGSKQRKQKTAQQNSNTSHNDNNSQLNQSQDDIEFQDRSILGENSSHTLNNHSMLVQECDLSAGGGTSVDQISTGLQGAVESDRLSANSIKNKQNLYYFKEKMHQATHQQSNHSVDTTPLTKAVNLNKKVNYKSKVNMKSFLLNNMKNAGAQNTPGPSSQKGKDFDRASQRSIVESTNAYIRANQNQEGNSSSRMSYLQSAGIIGSYPHGNGLSEADMNGSSTRQDFLASSNIPFRATIANNSQQMPMLQQQSHHHYSQHHNQQHQSQQNLLNNSLSQSSNGGLIMKQPSQLAPIDSDAKSQFRIQQTLQQRSAETNNSQINNNPSRGLDPDMTLFQLRQEIQRVPQSNAASFNIKSRQNEIGPPVVPTSSQQSQGKRQQDSTNKSIVQKDLNSSYQTIQMAAGQQQQINGNSKASIMLGGGSTQQNSYMFSAEKTRFEMQQSHPNLQNHQHNPLTNLDSSITSNHNNNKVSTHSNLTTISNYQSNQVESLKQAHSNKGARVNENPFKNGPKLHLFKKSRLIKTSSASRQITVDDGTGTATTIEHETNAAQDEDDQLVEDQQQSRLVVGKKQSSRATGLETNHTTLKSVDQQSQSQSNVYGTIDQKSNTDKHLAQYNKKKDNSNNILGSAPDHKQQQATSSLLSSGLMINQESEESLSKASETKISKKSNAVQKNKLANPYHNQVKVRNDERLRPGSQETLQTSSTINDMFRKADDKDQQTKQRSQIIAGLESQLSRRQSKVSNGSRSRMFIAESRTSHCSQTSYSEHQRTAQFNLPLNDSSSNVMYGSKHSFYGKQGNDIQHQQKQLQKDSASKSREGQQALLVSRGSKSSVGGGGSQSLPPGTKGKTTIQQQPPSHQKIQINQKLKASKQRNTTEMNQTFNIAGQLSNTADHSVLKDFTGKAHNEMTSSKQTFYNNKSAHKNSPQSVYQQSIKMKASQEESQERMTRNDSAQTPYFIPTPQRTESNWGGACDQAYQNNLEIGSNNKTSQQLYDAIQNVKTSDSIKTSFKNKAQKTQQLQNNQNKKMQLSKPNMSDFNIKIQKNDRKEIQKTTSSHQNSIQKSSDNLQDKKQDQYSGGIPVADSSNSAFKDQNAQRLLEDALQYQQSFDAQRRNLKSQNKAYRQPTRQGGARGGGRQNYQQENPSHSLPKTIL